MAQTPDGKPWKITINAPADFEVESQRLAFAVANEWNAFGIETNVQQMQDGPFFTAENTGNYEVGSYWGSSCGIVPDPFVRMEGWHKDYVRPNGTATSSNQGRYSNDTLSASDRQAPRPCLPRTRRSSTSAPISSRNL